MKWFLRRKTEVEALPDPQVAAEKFWQRWFEILPSVSAALGDREPQRVEQELREAVSLVHPDLYFSLERGQRAIYALVITGQEDPQLRAYTDAWKALAPIEDAIWEYHDSVPPVPDPTEVTINLGERRIALADFRFVIEVDEIAGVIDVLVYHPQLVELEETSRRAMLFLPLDAALGERLAAQRLRKVEAMGSAPTDSVSIVQLRDTIQELAHRAATS